MVLTDLGNKLSKALSKFKSEDIINNEVFKTLLNDIGRALLAADVDLRMIGTLQKNIRANINLEETPPGTARRRLIEETVIDELKNLLDPGKKAWRPKKNKFNVVMFVGLQGAGKTTTCTKLALYYKDRKKYTVGVVCADTFRAGAHDQLQQNCAKVKVQFYGNRYETDPAKIAEEGLEVLKKAGCNLVIVDTSGRHKQESALFEEMTAIEDAVNPDETIFVMDSSIGKMAYDQAKAFHDVVKVGSVILTKLDGHAKGGGALSAVAATESPITFIGTGEQFDEMEEFDAGGFVRRILGRGDIKGLAKRIHEADIKDNQEELLKKIQQGKLTLRDMKEQFQNVLKLGPVNSILQMIPGFSNLGKEHGDESQKRIQRFLHIMDSMTNEELDGDLKFLKVESRCRRICRGSGLPPSVLKELEAMYKPLVEAGKKLKNMKLKPGGMPSNPADFASMLPPQVLKQIGGPAGMRQLMQKFQDGTMDAQKMQQMMKGMGMGGMGMGGKKMKVRRR